MKHERSCFTINPDDFSSPPFSPKLNRPLSCKGHTRPNSSTSKLLPSLNNTTTADFSYSFLTTKNSNIKYQIESEKLYEETMQLKSTISSLRRELTELKRENNQKDLLIWRKDKEINDLLERNEAEESEDDNTTLILRTKRQNKELKNETDEMREKNEELRKNVKLTKMNEYTIENEILQGQLNEMKILINNAKEMKLNNNSKFEEMTLLQKNIAKQKIILNELNKNTMNSISYEKSLKESIDTMKKNIFNDNAIIKKNKETLLLLQKEKEKLSNDKTVNSNPQSEESYQKEISYLRKEISEYNIKLKRTSALVTSMKAQNSKLQERLSNKQKTNINKKNIEQHQIIDTKNNANTVENSEKIKKLKEKLYSSKEIETQLEKQMKLYQDKLKELSNGNEEQIEFGIDADNPYYSPDETNDPIQSNKFTSGQFNQFTYILFKNFEAKKITLDIAKEKIIDDFINEYNNDESHTSINENFDNIVNNLTEKIFTLTKNKNNYNYKILSIFISALLYNSEGSITKLLDYFNVLFSYTREYSVDEEEKMKSKLSSKYKKLVSKLVQCIKDANSNNNDYISLIEVKNIIDNNSITLKDKYIEFIFYLMKHFDDKSAKWEDLNIKNLSDLLVTTASQSQSESMTEITNEEYIKTISEALTLIVAGLTKEKKDLRKVFETYIKTKIVNEGEKETNCEVVSIDEFNDELRKININLSDLQLSCLCTKYCINNEFNYINIGALEQDVKNSSNTSLNGFGHNESIDDIDITDDKNVVNNTN